jgi:hypothetical protein
LQRFGSNMAGGRYSTTIEPDPTIEGEAAAPDA